MKLTIVAVLYKQKIEESKTFQTLNKAFVTRPNMSVETELVIYDNSPDSQKCTVEEKLWGKVQYIHDHRNLGLATAYNYAFQAAKENGSKWLLLLDHDTELTEDYVDQIGSNLDVDPTIAAVVPRVFSEETMISPVVADALRPLKTEKLQAGLQEKPTMAINSGSLIRVSFIEENDGFNKNFPLDYLDHWLFHEIYAKGYKVLVLEASLNHELSVLDYSRVSLERYRSILDTEIYYFKNYKNELLPAYKIQLMKRLLKQVAVVKNKKIAAYTLRRIFSI
ncbi:glycosyltransferase [Robertmurraya sp. P23]|uniref:glycosyltransferase n=1 Tax=Robertmurraya sp. P23 TaxID=3436931 RepID=UPI003D98C5A9